MYNTHHRKYTNGSVLRMHVDTVNTHVVSAIINVDQQLDEEVSYVLLNIMLHYHIVEAVC
jgi:hypothetical protein